MKYSDELTQIFSEILGIDQSQVLHVKRSDLASWSSLKHIELVFAIEERMDIRLSKSEIVSLDSFKKALELVNQYAS